MNRGLKHDPESNAKKAIDELISHTRGKKRRQFFEWSQRRIDLDEYAKLQSRFISNRKALKYMIKYLDLAYFLNRSFTKANTLRLHRRKPIDILDIGCGPGHFLLAVEFLGHNGVGLDIPDFPLVNELARLFGVDMRHHRMQASEPLPDIGRFDLIIANSVGWHRKRLGILFSRKEWEFLFDDLVQAHLKPGGRVLLNMNRKRYTQGLDLDDRKLLNLTERFGGTVDRKNRTIRIPS